MSYERNMDQCLLFYSEYFMNYRSGKIILPDLLSLIEYMPFVKFVIEGYSFLYLYQS